MLTYGEALTLIESGQVDASNKTDVLNAVKDNVATVLSEKRKVVARLSEVESNLQSVMAVAGASGDDLASQVKDLNAKLGSLKGELEASKTQLSAIEAAKVALETEKATLLAEKQKSDRTAHLSQLATKSGANQIILDQLTKDLEIEKMAIEGDEVKIDGKPIKEWVEADELRKAFIPALFPGGFNGNSNGTPTQPTQPATVKLPSAPPSTETSNPIDAVYVKATGRDPSKTDWITKKR